MNVWTNSENVTIVLNSRELTLLLNAVENGMYGLKRQMTKNDEYKADLMVRAMKTAGELLDIED